jgi:hypothetical protein
MNHKTESASFNGFSFTSENCVGLYRCGNYLLVDRKQHRFPPICLKTGVETDETFEVNDTFLPPSQSGVALVLGGGLGYAVAKEKCGTRVTLTVPLDSNYAVDAGRGMVFPWVGVAIGLVLMVVGFLRAVTDWRGTVILMSGFALTILMLIYAFLRSQKVDAPIKVKNLQPDFIWLQGVHPDVLAQFPDWRADQ